jgi:kinetochore protein NNF1
VLTKRNVVPSLNALDHLIAEAMARKRTAELAVQGTSRAVEVPVAPHTLSPEALLVAKLGPWLGGQKTVLEGTLKEVEGENEKLGKSIVEQRAEIEELVKGLERLVGDLEKSAKMVGGVDGIRGVAAMEEMEE